jgi:hypothetical protein
LLRNNFNTTLTQTLQFLTSLLPSQDTIEQMEQDILKTLHHVRHSEDTHILDLSMHQVLQKLDLLQKQYRTYGKYSKRRCEQM